MSNVTYPRVLLGLTRVDHRMSSPSSSSRMNLVMVSL